VKHTDPAKEITATGEMAGGVARKIGRKRIGIDRAAYTNSWYY